MTLDHRELRNALGQFATGISIITVLDKEGKAQAMTVNSFSAVSLDPPLVLWSLRNDSECFDSFSQANRFAISILSNNNKEQATLYSTKGAHQLQEEHCAYTDDGFPYISNPKAMFDCHRETSHIGGDHLILIGRVSQCEYSSEDAPLLFYSGKYASLNQA